MGVPSHYGILIHNISERIYNQISERTYNQISERVYNQISERVFNQISERVYNQKTKHEVIFIESLQTNNTLINIKMYIVRHLYVI